MTARPILLVEDNADDRDLTRMALARYRVANPLEIAEDGQEALDYLEDAGRPLPALVLLDLKLPRLSGHEVLRRIRANQRTRLVPVVVLSGSNEERDITESYGLGVNAYVRKPVEFGDFSEAVRQIGLFWLVLNEPPPVS